MKEHLLKTVHPYFKFVWDRVKKFELRKNDRDFKTGDILILQEYDPINEQYMSREIHLKVDYILHGGKFGLKDGYCIMQCHEVQRQVLKPANPR
jgi:hypothetical protein